jgi:hypothetical protein
MKDFGKTFMLAVMLSILLFFAGLFLYGAIVEVVLPNDEKIFYQDIGAKGVFGNSFLFSFLLALMPIFIVCTWGLCRAYEKADRFSIASIVIVFAFLSVFVRQHVLAAYLKRLSLSTEMAPDDLTISYPLNRLNFEWYMFAGLCAGCIIACILYRRRRN